MLAGAGGFEWKHSLPNATGADTVLFSSTQQTLLIADSRQTLYYELVTQVRKTVNSYRIGQKWGRQLTMIRASIYGVWTLGQAIIACSSHNHPRNRVAV